MKDVPMNSAVMKGVPMKDVDMDKEWTLSDFGWDEGFATEFALCAKPGWVPARLIRETKINFTALLGDGETLDVVVSGKVWNEAETDADLPAVGDWVGLDLGGVGDEAVIRVRLPRRSCFSRKAPGKTSAEQVMGANVDYVVVVTEPGADFNARRMERYLALIERSGARPIVLINKSDLFPKKIVRACVEEVCALAPHAYVHGVSAREGTGLEVLKKYLKPGVTLMVVGSSGVGKSTLINELLGDEWLWTGEVNEVTGKGRHTTVARELVVLETGGMLIDNPGIREVQMWTNEATLRESFADVEALVVDCRFGNCRHRKETGCALLAAVQDGRLDRERYEHFLSLEDEIAELKKRQKKRQMNVERADKRNRKVKARNYNDRVDLERREQPHRRNHDET